MTSSGLEWDYFDCLLHEASSPMPSPQGFTLPLPTAAAQTLRLSNIFSDWSLSPESAPTAPSGSSAPLNFNGEERAGELHWRKARREPRRSERLKEGDQTALHRAAVVGNSDVISALIQEGCAQDRQDKDGNTALHEVSWHGFSQSVKLLVKAGANVHAKNKAGNTALHLACQNGHAQSVRLLLLGGSRPDSKNNVGDTCLHVASRYNHVAMIRILLGAFCSVNEKNQAGDTPLHIAASLNHKKTVRLLLEAGTDSSVKNSAGQTALDQAREHNNPEVALLLAKAPQVQSFTRGRSVRERRDKWKAEGRAQSVPRDEMLPSKESVSAADDTHSSDYVARRQGERAREPVENTGKSPAKKNRKKHKEKPSLSEPLCQRENKHSEAAHRKKGKQHNSAQPAPPAQPPHCYKAYQLYTLYRGKNGKIMQAPLNGCRCEPLISKLENQLEATKEEMRSEIHTVQERMNSKLGELDRKSKHQIKALDKITVERVSAERTECLHRIDQRAMLERLEGEKRQQASVVNDLKNWCLSKIQNIEVRFTGDGRHPKPGQAPHGTEVAPEGSLERLAALPTPLSAGSASSLAPAGPANGAPAAEAPGQHYFVVQVDSSPDDRHIVPEHSTPPPKSLPASPLVVRPKDRAQAFADLRSLDQELQGMDLLDPGMGQGRGRTSRASRASSLSPATERRCGGRLDRDRDRDRERERGRERDRARHQKKQPQGRTKGRRDRQQGGAPRTLEVFADRPAEPSFAQERNAMHAVEVTQYFFEAVSTQMERWYERKIQEARWQADQKAQQDRAALLERISYLEAQLQLLRTGVHEES
ncbi:ankyrin repeat domain-containing protein 6b isoform X1 [Anguilla anguilla]|uniref:ankyrin repeat domain-containing protein 6b isoform X1 n=1 Tax=Anguilla anguilla TaxID=7936 RepID=UPI0015A77BE6|nr:ankyrin repeat domain-containing protein 6b isoform X1 [Anguilla anguilla]